MNNVVNLEEDYFDLTKMFPPGTTYRDYEGLTSPDNVKTLLHDPLVQEAIHIYTDEGAPPRLEEEFLLTLLAHFAYENEDQGGYTISVDEAVNFIHIVAMIFSCRYWMKVSADG